MNEISLKPAHTVTELAITRQHQGGGNWPTIMERAVEDVHYCPLVYGSVAPPFQGNPQGPCTPPPDPPVSTGTP